jgi:hypothetical protein
MRLWSAGILCVVSLWTWGCEPAAVEHSPEPRDLSPAPRGEVARGADDLLLGQGRGQAVRALTTPERWATLTVAQEASRAALDDAAGLSPSAARNIAAWRAGEDGAEGTEDDRYIDTLGELDAIPRVGDATMEALRGYAVRTQQLEEVTLWLGLPCVERRCLPVEGWDPLDHLGELTVCYPLPLPLPRPRPG